MELQHQAMRFDYVGQLAEAELPREILYEAVLRFRHRDPDPEAALRKAFEPLAGSARRRRWPFGPTRLVWDRPPYSLQATLRDGEVRLASRNRLQPAAARRVVAACASLEGAEDLAMEADVAHFQKALSNLRACTPCQARRL